jgi:hypothetical protein
MLFAMASSWRSRSTWSFICSSRGAASDNQASLEYTDFIYFLVYRTCGLLRLEIIAESPCYFSRFQIS